MTHHSRIVRSLTARGCSCYGQGLRWAHSTQCREKLAVRGHSKMGLKKIVIRGARQHNLKNISLEIPRNTLTVITGLSGSGKSSLAFDTLYAEGQRRYVESLSAYARQFLDQMERPEVDSIEGLSPSIAIEQKTTTRSPRSTVGTITEIYDYLRVVYSAIGTPHCPNCGREIARQSTEQIVQSVMALKPDDRIMVLAPVVRGRKGEYKKELEKYAKEGYVRARVDGELVNLDEPQAARSPQESHDRDRGGPAAAEERDRAAARAIDRDGAEADGRAGDDRGGGRRRACVFGKARVPGLRDFGAAARAAVVQLQFAVWRVPRMPRAGLEIRFRSGEGDRRLDEAALRRRARAGLGLGSFAAHDANCGRGVWIRSRHAVREVIAQGAEPDPARQSGEWRLGQGIEFPGRARALGKRPRRIEFGHVPRMADAIYVARAVHGLRRAAAAARKPRGENRGAFDCGFHGAAADGSARGGRQDSRPDSRCGSGKSRGGHSAKLRSGSTSCSRWGSAT